MRPGPSRSPTRRYRSTARTSSTRRCERWLHARTHVGHLFGAEQRRPDRGQARQPPLGDDLVGGFGDHVEHATDAAVVVEQRAVRVGEVALFGESVAFDDEQLVLGPCRAARRHHLVEHRPDRVPDLGPDLGRRRTERVRVLLAAEHRPVAVVVDLHQIGSPHHQHRKARGEAHADGGPQTDRPL